MSRIIKIASLACLVLVSCAEKKIVIRNDPALNEQLIEAVKEKDFRTVGKLIKKGADPNGAGAGGKNSGFHIALYVNDTKIIRYLLDSGADIAKPDQNNYAPLSLAARANNVEILNVLIEKGADVNHVNNNSIRSTAIMDAAEANAVDAMKALMAKGADIDVLDKWNAPALTIAADKNNYEAVELLVEAGAELNVIDSGLGYTALDFAVKNKNDRMISLLESKGAFANKLKK